MSRGRSRRAAARAERTRAATDEGRCPACLRPLRDPGGFSSADASADERRLCTRCEANLRPPGGQDEDPDGTGQQ